MSDFKRYLVIKSQVENINRKVERAKGALHSELSRLKKMFGCATIEDGQKELKRLELKRREAKKKFELELAKFEDKWTNKL